MTVPRPTILKTSLTPIRRGAAALLCIALAGCFGSHKPIKIGLMSTFGDPLGLPLRYGAELAAQEINAAGGIHGRPIEFVEAEDHGDADSATAAADRLANSDVVAVVGGAFSGPTLAAAPVFNDESHAVVEISPSASSPEVTDAGPWTFRVCASDLAHAAQLAQFIRQKLNLTRGAVLYMNNQYGRGFRQVFEAEFKRMGGEILFSDPYLPDHPQDTGPYFDQINLGGGVQFILAASYETDGAELLRQMRQRGLKIPLLGGDGLEGLEREGALADGTYQTAAYLTAVNTPENRAFVDRYVKAFPKAHPPNQTAVATYDIVRLLAQVIGDVGTDRKAIRDALAEVGSKRPTFQGVTGPIAFDRNGDVPTKKIYIAEVQGGAVHLVEGQ
ncbi:MAG TPA: branched-chain amino acid ABC transporter substrate-binding protein [Gemmatimonadales bacterium]|nr:branched-chain amino acid ABC transporter substrate-binding protein [Gemmatimonadales bacterium]